AKITALGVFLIEPADDIGRHADERAKGGCALDAVLPAVPRAAKDLRDLLEVIDEKFSHVVVKRIAVLGPKRIGGERFFQLLRKRRLRDSAGAYAEQFDFACHR